MPIPTAHFYDQTRTARKIIVVDLGFLGDSIHLIPALHEIKRHYPDAALHTLSAVIGAELLQMAPCVDKAWGFPLTPQSPPWWRHWGIIAALRREKYDVAFNFSGSDRTIFVTALTGAKWRLAHQGERRHFWNRWLIANWVPRHGQEVPVFEQRRQTLAAAGLVLEPPRFELRVPEEARAATAQIFAGHAIHLSINASTPLKEWPLGNWIELAKLMLHGDPSARLIATAAANARETERLRQFAEAVNDPRLVCFEGLSIAQLAGAMERCRLHFGADSGVLHLAMALGVPTFTIFRKYPGLKEWIPPGPQHKFLAVGCGCVDEGENRCLAKGEAACLGTITAARVFEASRSMRPLPSQKLSL